jgi:hypothetical protein
MAFLPRATAAEVGLASGVEPLAPAFMSQTSDRQEFVIYRAREMKVLTDDPDWARDVYKARALAMMFVRRHGRAVSGSPFRQAVRNDLAVTYDPDRTPVLLTVDAGGIRVLSVEWKEGDAWRMEIETYRTGRWEARLNAMVRPRPWLERWRAMTTFTGSLPRNRAA